MTAALVPATTARPGTTTECRRVPWSTVLPLAVVAAFGSGFWLIVIRGAVGAIERTQGPFVAWLEESTLLLPLYVFAVLAALTLALRWFGPGPHRARTVAVTLLLVAVAVTLAATAVQVASAVYDYRLQTTQVVTMALHDSTCDARCVADQQHSGLVLQLRALGLGSLVMMVSNLALLGLTVGFRGGRLDLASSKRATQGHAGRVARFDSVDLFLPATLLGTAAIHATRIGEQLAQRPVAGVAVLLLTIAEVDAALLFVLRLRIVHYLAAAAVSVGPLLVWLYALTVGLPFEPDGGVRQPVGMADTAAALLEAATLLVAVAALRSRRPHRPGPTQHAPRLALVAVAAVSVVGVAVGLGAMGSAAPPPLQHAHHETA